MQQLNTTRFETVDAKNKPVLFTVGTEIMDYIEPARTFGSEDMAKNTVSGRYQPRLIAVPDRRWNPVGPMVLTLGNQRRLILVRRTENESAGWDRIDLSEKLGLMAKGPVTAFGVAWADDGIQDKVTLAVAVEVGGEHKRSQIFIAYDLSSRTADWHNIQWVDYGCRDDLSIDAIRVLRDAKGVWTTVLSAGDGTKQNAYLIRSDRPRSFADDGLVFSTATDLENILDFQAGAFIDGGALHVLGTDRGDERALYTRPIPAFNTAGKPQTTSVYPLSCPNGANVLALGLDQGAGCGADLYIGGQGVHCISASDIIKHQEEADQKTVIPPALASSVKRLLVAESRDGAATVWALLEHGRLMAIRRPDRDSGWETPLNIREGVVEIAPVEGDSHVTTSVLLVYQGGKATHLWRDAGGIWQEAEIRVADPQEASKITCFGTNLSILDERGTPRPKVSVTIRASVPSSLVINGRSYYVGPQLPVSVETGFNGAVTIFNRALSFTPATYRIAVDGMEHCLDVNPASSLYARFGSLTAAELCNAKMPDGTDYLLGKEYRTGTGTAAVKSLVQAMQKAAELATFKDQNVPGIQLAHSTTPFSSAMSAASLPNDYCWGVASDGRGGLRTLSGLQASQLAGAGENAGGIFVQLGDSVSDLLEAIWSGVKEAVSFVIHKTNNVVEFVCSIGNQIKRFILSSIEEIGAFFKSAWASIKTSVEKVWDYLKFLFNWDDIIAVRNKIAEMIDQDFKDLKKQVLGLTETVGPAFDEVIEKIKVTGTTLGVRRSKQIVLAPGSGAIAKKQSDHGAIKDTVLSSGPGAWIMDQLGTLSREIIDFKVPPSDASSQSFVANLIDDQINNISSLSKELGQDFKEIFGDKGFNFSDLDIEKIQRIILAITFRIAEAAAIALKSVVIRLIEGLASLIDLFHAILFAKISFPFIEKLVKLVSGNTVDTSVSLIDVILLPPAILTTITYKLVFKDSIPISDVLKDKLPSSNIVTAQSRDTIQQLYFIKNMAGTYVSFVSIAFDAFPASTPVITQQATTTLQWCGWGAGFVSHLIGNNPLLPGRQGAKITKQCNWLIYVIGLLQYMVR